MEFFVNEWVLGSGAWAPIFFVIARAFAIIIPPIPGFIVDTAGLALFPWGMGFLLAETGIVLGGCVAFFLARTLREPLVKRVAPMKMVAEWESQYSEKQKFWTLVVLRLVSNAAFDYISYAAGLTKLRFSTFFFSSLLGTIPSMLLFYVMGGALVSFFGPWVTVGIGLLATVIILTQFGKIGEAVGQFTAPKQSANTPAENLIDTTESKD